MEILNNICVCIVTLVSIVFFMKNYKPVNVMISRVSECNFLYNKNVYKKLMIVSIIICFALRFIQLGSLPSGMNQDELMGAVDAYALATHGTDRFGTWLPAHFTAWGYGQMSVLLSYIMVPFIKIFGLNAFAIRLPMAIISTIAALAVYKIVQVIINKDAALIALLFIAINPYHFMQSRWSMDCNIFPHIFIIGFCFLVYGLSKKRYVYISMIFFALCMYSYGEAFFMVPFFLLAVCIYLLVKKCIRFTDVFICVLIYFGIAFPIYGTMLINFMGWDTVELPFTTMTYFKDSVRSNDIIFFSDNIIEDLKNNCANLIYVVFLQNTICLWNSIIGYGTLYKCSIPLLIVGLVVVINKLFKNERNIKNKSFYMFLFTYFLLCLFLGIIIHTINENRINIMIYCNVLLVSIAIYYIIKRFKIVAPILFIIYGVLAISFFTYYFTDYNSSVSDYFYQDYMKALYYADEFNGDKYYIEIEPKYNVKKHINYSIAEIYTMFTQQIDSEYYQGKTDTCRDKNIPYSERYIYSEFNKDMVDGSDSVYVIFAENEKYFNDANYNKKEFGDYAVVTLK